MCLFQAIDDHELHKVPFAFALSILHLIILVPFQLKLVDKNLILIIIFLLGQRVIFVL